MDQLVFAKVVSVEHLQFFVAAIVLEVANAQKVEIWGLVPLIRQGFRDRDLAAEKDIKAGLVISKIRKTDDDFLADAKGLIKHVLRFYNFLQALVQDYVVKGFVGILK